MFNKNSAELNPFKLKLLKVKSKIHFNFKQLHYKLKYLSKKTT